MNTIGRLYTLTSFGESHGEALGGVIDGCPAGIPLSEEEIQHELNRRRPGQSSVTTSRTEEDRVEILSGIFEGVTTGSPIGFIVRNKDQRSRDYDAIKDLFRPSHADYTMQEKYGVRDWRTFLSPGTRGSCCRGSGSPSGFKEVRGFHLWIHVSGGTDCVERVLSRV